LCVCGKESPTAAQPASTEFVSPGQCAASTLTNFRRPVGAGSAGLELGSDRPKPAGIFSARATGLPATHSRASTLAMYSDGACVGVRAENTPSQHSTDHTEQFPRPNTRRRRKTVLQHRTRRRQSVYPWGERGGVGFSGACVHALDGHQEAAHLLHPHVPRAKLCACQLEPSPVLGVHLGDTHAYT
jgi:hypothetical protein